MFSSNNNKFSGGSITRRICLNARWKGGNQVRFVCFGCLGVTLFYFTVSAYENPSIPRLVEPKLVKHSLRAVILASREFHDWKGL